MNSATRSGFLCLGVCIWCSTASGADFDCLVEPRQVVEIRAASEGLISRIPVERGDLVKAGQVLVELDSGVQNAAMQAAKFRATIEGNIQSRSHRAEYAKLKLDRQEKLAAKNFTSGQDRDVALAEQQIAEADLVDAKEAKRLAELDYRRSMEELRLRTIRSPFDGVVMDRMMHPGDLADNRDLRKPILKLADLSVLHVEVFVPASAYSRLNVGQQVEVVLDPAIGGRYPAKVAVIDRVFEAASGTVGVRLDMPNPGLKVPAGVKCKMTLADGAGPRATSFGLQRDVR